MTNNNESPEPSNFFFRWWKLMVTVAVIIAGVLHYYKELRQVIPLVVADVQSLRQYLKPAEPSKEVATVPSNTTAPSSLTTQSLPPRSAPPCVAHTPARILEVLTQAEGHRKKFEKDYASRQICGWFATVQSVAKRANGETRLWLLSPTGPTIVVDVGVLTTALGEGEIVQVFGTLHNYQRKGFFAVAAVHLINARAVRR